MSLLTLKDSVYSDMSTRISASDEPNINSASFFARYVLPTPVGPRNIKAPIGWLGSFSPTRFRWMAFTILSMALSWAMTCCFNSWLIPFRRIPSSWAIRCTGIPVIILTTSATSVSVIVGRTSTSPSCHFLFSSCNSRSRAVCLSR